MLLSGRTLALSVFRSRLARLSGVRVVAEVGAVYMRPVPRSRSMPMSGMRRSKLRSTLTGMPRPPLAELVVSRSWRARTASDKHGGDVAARYGTGDLAIGHLGGVRVALSTVSLGDRYRMFNPASE